MKILLTEILYSVVRGMYEMNLLIKNLKRHDAAICKAFPFSPIASSALPFRVRQHIKMPGVDGGRKHTSEEEQDNWNRDRTSPEYRADLRSAPVVQKEVGDSFSVMSQIAPCTEYTVRLPPHLAGTL